MSTLFLLKPNGQRSAVGGGTTPELAHADNMQTARCPAHPLQRLVRP
jgi:hypothetical protein